MSCMCIERDHIMFLLSILVRLILITFICIGALGFSVMMPIISEAAVDATTGEQLLLTVAVLSTAMALIAPLGLLVVFEKNSSNKR
jgi:Trk-type K+ transport system membrane component